MFVTFTHLIHIHTLYVATTRSNMTGTHVQMPEPQNKLTISHDVSLTTLEISALMMPLVHCTQETGRQNRSTYQYAVAG